MKYSWMIVCCLSFCGCEEVQQRREDRDKCTISQSFYLNTVLHDEHLFILSTHGNFMHHMDCPCLKSTTPKKPENLTPPTIIFDSTKSILIKP
jgi:hypothetical protein